MAELSKLADERAVAVSTELAKVAELTAALEDARCTVEQLTPPKAVLRQPAIADERIKTVAEHFTAVFSRPQH